ncbi:hypothetical protein L195_g062403, partial [Trifolium pratense]
MELGWGDVENPQHFRLKGSERQPDVERLNHTSIK